jgi:prepilin-type processing-associated H-X9-DG protein/prepilin-type N-terminal cleavage/methylation domain-containing protein
MLVKLGSMAQRPGCRFYRGNAATAFTLVELLVVMSIIGLLVALLLPALAASRDAARNSACKSHLREIGVGLHAFAENHNERFCSGAFSWEKDGAVTEIGWVADLVNQNILLGEMLCPGNPAQLSETYSDLMQMNASAANACNVDWKGSPATTYPDGSVKINPCRKIAEDAAMTPGAEPRRVLVEERIYKKWYNTNYAASWFLVRGSVSLNASGQLNSSLAGCPASNLSRRSTGGPLSRRLCENGAAPQSVIPFIGDARPLALTEKSCSHSIGLHSPTDPLAAAMTLGPVDKSTKQPPNPASGTPYAGAGGWWGTWNQTVQDYRNFGPVHGGSCNILFADGSVRSFTDANADAILNNGLDSAAPVEMEATQVYSGWSLRAEQKGG